MNFLKRNTLAIATTLAGLGTAIAGFCSATAIITLPETALADLEGSASQIMTDVWVLVALAIGIPLGFYIIRKVISLIPKH